jgi:hypothetical protein
VIVKLVKDLGCTGECGCPVYSIIISAYSIIISTIVSSLSLLFSLSLSSSLSFSLSSYYFHYHHHHYFIFIFSFEIYDLYTFQIGFYF